MTSRIKQRRQETFLKVLQLLQANPATSTRELARSVCISNGAAHYCVTALVEKGFVKINNFTRAKKKSGYIYQLTPRGIREKAKLSVQFLQLKRAEFDELKAEIEYLEAELYFDYEKQSK